MDGITENSIIELFNFDRRISELILSNVHNIERKFNTGFCYIVGAELKCNNYPNGDIMNALNLVFDNVKSASNKLSYYVINSKIIFLSKNIKITLMYF